MMDSLREREIILLRAVTELINSIVNLEVLTFLGEDPDTEVRFPSSTHQKYFNIVLVDFLSRIDDAVVPSGGTYLEGLKGICRNPQFEPHSCSVHLGEAVSQLDAWLKTRVQIKTWLPSIDLEAELPITRALLVRIGGNISKHNVLRLGRTATELQKVLADAGKPVDHDQALLALGDVYEFFHRDVLAYHTGMIAELLNNVRWGIHEYLAPEFSRSFTPDPPDPHRYHYVVPADIQGKLAIDSYWGAMNDVRRGPYIRRFVVTQWLKMRY